MLNLRSSELANAAELRARAIPQRLAAVGFMAIMLHMAFGWPLVWLWALAYVAASGLEVAVGRRFVSRLDGDLAGSGVAYTACVALVSVIYGAMSVPLLLLEHAGDGEVFGVILLAGGLVNLLIVSRASWAAFLATVVPYGGYLLLNPFLAYAAGLDEISWVHVAGVLLLLAHAYTAWGRHRHALLAEAAARAESERRRNEAEFAAAAKSAFVATVSHELRTPLSGVMAAGAQLQKQVWSKPDQEAVDVLVDAGAFMKTLLDDLLDLAKLEAGRMTIEAVSYDLGELVWKLERHWSAAAREAGKPLQLTAALNMPNQVLGDPTRLRQIINNLLSNAVKFTGPQGVTWSVEGQEDGDLWWLEMRVTDSGPGIPADKLDRLFTAFDQADETIARTHGGTGLGLALSRELARLMGGELAVESRPGKGSTFILTVPVRRAEPVAAALLPATQQEEPAAPRRGGVKVLVVDDHEINRRTASLLLEAGGAEVSAVASGEEALALLDAEPFDVVLSDLHMPGMNGLALTRAIRQRTGLNRSAPVIALTGADSAEDQAACRAAGMRACVSKPIDPRLLYQAIEEACAGRSPAADRARFG